MPEPRQSRSFQAGASIYEIGAAGLAWRVERGSVRLDASTLSQCEIADRRVLEGEVNEPVPKVRRILRLDGPGKLQKVLEKLNA